MNADLKKALPPLLVVLFGALLAYLMVASSFAWILLAAIPAIGGWFSLRRADATVERDPLGSLTWFEWGQVLPYAFAVVVLALLIYVAVLFAPPKIEEAASGAASAPDLLAAYFGEILKAVSGGISAFLTAAFIKSRDEPDGWVAEAVKGSFTKHFTGFPNDPEADRALHASDYNGHGWDPEGRRARATQIAAAVHGE